jgi:putative flavoprotein involved in K+ transport
VPWPPQLGVRDRSCNTRHLSEANGHASIDLESLGAAVFAGGFRPDYGSWAHVPGAFDDHGFPIHENGARSSADGLYFVGVHFPRKRKSSLFMGVGEDAAMVAGTIAERQTAVSGLAP